MKFSEHNFGDLHDIYGTALHLLAEARKAEAQLPEEERERRKEARRKEREDRQRYHSIIANICPNCSGKLVRGKKNKKNNYKRDWNCSSCKTKYSM